MNVNAEFCPAWASPPSETVLELAKRKGLTQAVLAYALGVAENELPRVLEGDFPIDEVRAAKLAAQIGGSSRFWLTREAQYRQAVNFVVFH
jgi:HTH-type transcriptional regulator/antitoxin HigA